MLLLCWTIASGDEVNECGGCVMEIIQEFIFSLNWLVIIIFIILSDERRTKIRENIIHVDVYVHRQHWWHQKIENHFPSMKSRLKIKTKLHGNIEIYLMPNH